MLYLKRILDEEKKELNIEEAKTAISEGKNIEITISEKHHLGSFKTTFFVNQITGITEVEGCFIIKAKDGVYPVAGWDEKIEKIKILYFMDFTVGKKISNLEDALIAVEQDHLVRARSWQLQTDIIARFLEDSLFETKSGNLYKMI